MKHLSSWAICLFVTSGWFLAASAAPAAGDLSPFLSGKKVWEMSADQFSKRYIRGGRFRWVSVAKSSARLPRSTQATIGKPKLRVGEVIVRFKEKRVNQIEMSIYNRGDDGMISEEQFKSRLRAIAELIDAKAGSAHQSLPATGKQTTHRLQWQAKENQFQVEYAFIKEDESKRQRFRPEFIILKAAPPSGGGVVANKLKTRSDLQREVLRRDNGDHVIKSVPMVDQGQKGYCAVASAERVMRYYGIDVNQHEMAQICNSSSRGTSGAEMTKALQAAAGKYHTRVLTLFEFSYSDEKGWKKMEKVAKAYNRLAAKEDKPTFDTERSWIPIGLLLSRGDPQLLKQVRATGTKYERFKSSVERYVDDGVPILWALQLGVFKERNLPQMSGGHMRLIIGYNEKTEELLYTDSWGAGHELKRMPMDEAYTMTMQLTVLQPSK